jgi:hypothetical protein
MCCQQIANRTVRMFMKKKQKAGEEDVLTGLLLFAQSMIT